MPAFKGGDAALMDYIAKNTKYPETAKTKGIQGKVIVRFAVETDGSVDKVSILKGVDPELDQEAFRVVSSLPAFEKPGVKDGKDVAVWYMVPINFTLK
jgi:TonB family protein